MRTQGAFERNIKRPVRLLIDSQELAYKICSGKSGYDGPTGKARWLSAGSS